MRDWLATPAADSRADYIDHLRGNGRSASHVADCERLTGRVLDECGMKSLRDIAGTPIERWLAGRAAEGIAPRTRNSYLQAVRGFCRWCVANDRLAADPTKRIRKLDEAADRRRQRRSMTAEELRLLLYVARWRPLAEYGRQTVANDDDKRTSKRGNWRLATLTLDELPDAIERARKRLVENPEFVAKLETRGRGRALVYKSLVLTGLRRGELASLTVGSLMLDSDPPYLVLEAGNAKNRKQAELPLRNDLADDLRLWLTEKQAAYCKSVGETVGVLSITTGEPVTLPLDTPLLDVPRGLIKAFDRVGSIAGPWRALPRAMTGAIRSTFMPYGIRSARYCRLGCCSKNRPSGPAAFVN